MLIPLNTPRLAMSASTCQNHDRSRFSRVRTHFQIQKIINSNSPFDDQQSSSAMMKDLSSQVSCFAHDVSLVFC
jgi:hypothetical protein